MESQLKLIHSEIDEPIKSAEKAIKVSISILEKLKGEFFNTRFESKWEEIHFFRHIKPQFAAKLIYYNDIYNIESNKPFGSNKAIRKYYNSELLKLENFFNENLDFYKYYRTGNTDLDTRYFLRGKHDVRLTLDSFYFQADHRFSTSHDYKVARILANNKLKMYLENAISHISQKAVTNPASVNQRSALKWTGSKVALVELIYALHAEGIFNNGNSELKEAVHTFEVAFNIDLGQFNRVFLEIRARKSERAKFLTSLKEKLILRMVDADEL